MLDDMVEYMVEYKGVNLLPISQFVTDILIPMNWNSLYTIILKIIVHKKDIHLFKFLKY